MSVTTSTNPFNQRISKGGVSNGGNAPELIAVTAGAFAGGVGSLQAHNPNPFPAGVAVTGSYIALQLNGVTTLQLLPPATSPLINAITVAQVREYNGVTTVRTVVTLNRSGSAPTGPGNTDEIRIRGYNANNTNTSFLGVLPGFWGNLYQQSPLLQVDVCNKFLVPLVLSATNQPRGRVLADGTIALTMYVSTTQVESALTYAQLNTVLGTANDVAIISCTGSFVSGLAL